MYDHPYLLENECRNFYHTGASHLNILISCKEKDGRDYCDRRPYLFQKQSTIVNLELPDLKKI